MTTAPIQTETAPHEPWTHALARESRALLRMLVIIMMLATVITMITFPFWGIFPAILLLVVYGMLWLANIAEHRSRTGKHIPANEAAEMSEVDVDEAEGVEESEAAHRTEPHVAMEEIPMSTLLKESITGAEIVVGIAVAAVIIGAMLFHPTMLALALLFLFPYMIVLLAPVWLGWFSKELRDEDLRHREARRAGLPS